MVQRNMDYEMVTRQIATFVEEGQRMKKGEPPYPQEALGSLSTFFNARKRMPSLQEFYDWSGVFCSRRVLEQMIKEWEFDRRKAHSSGGPSA